VHAGANYIVSALLCTPREGDQHHLIKADFLTGSSNSNETLYVSLVRPTDKGVETLHTFNPKMTYSIFGDEETVFGYKDLRMKLRFNISDMRPGTQVLYTTRFKQVGDTQPTDIREVLEPYLPASE